MGSCPDPWALYSATGGGMDRHGVVMARQAIYDRAMQVAGYELLFRPSSTDELSPNGVAMTNSVVSGSLQLGIDALVGDTMLFCNADRDLLIGDTLFQLPPAQTVVEILETVRPDDAVLAGCARLMAAGYRLALDDFLFFDQAQMLLEMAWLVKVDIQQVPVDELASMVTRLHRYQVELLAEKIETTTELAHCQQLGFGYFQGYLLARPQLLHELPPE